MKELREFIKGLEEMEFEVVSVGEVGEEEGIKLISLKDIRKEIEKIEVKEVTDIYYECFEFFTNDDRYMTINAVY